METNPMHHDTDGDGLTDWQEVTGMPVTIGGEEVIVRSNPLSYDSDGDGLSDSDEINGFEMTIGDDTVTVTTNPLSGDTDADGLSDADERKGKNNLGEWNCHRRSFQPDQKRHGRRHDI